MQDSEGHSWKGPDHIVLIMQGGKPWHCTSWLAQQLSMFSCARVADAPHRRAASSRHPFTLSGSAFSICMASGRFGRTAAAEAVAPTPPHLLLLWCMLLRCHCPGLSAAAAAREAKGISGFSCAALAVLSVV